MRCVRDVAEHALRQVAQLPLLRRDAGRVGVSPFLRMVGVALGAVHVHVHLVARHEAEEVLADLGAVGHAVVALDDAAVLHVGVVLNLSADDVVGVRIEDLLEGSQAAERGVGVLANDKDVGQLVAFLPPDGKEVAVVLVRCGEAAVHAKPQKGVPFRRFFDEDGRLAVFLEHLGGAVACVLVYAVPGDDVHRLGQCCRLACRLRRVRHGINAVGVLLRPCSHAAEQNEQLKKDASRFHGDEVVFAAKLRKSRDNAKKKARMFGGYRKYCVTLWQELLNI